MCGELIIIIWLTESEGQNSQNATRPEDPIQTKTQSYHKQWKMHIIKNKSLNKTRDKSSKQFNLTRQSNRRPINGQPTAFHSC